MWQPQRVRLGIHDIEAAVSSLLILTERDGDLSDRKRVCYSVMQSICAVRLMRRTIERVDLRRQNVPQVSRVADDCVHFLCVKRNRESAATQKFPHKASGNY